MGLDDETIKCLHCEVDLRECGILEYGLQAFEIDLKWSVDRQTFALTGGEPRYDNCTEIYWQCKNCGTTCRRILTTSRPASTTATPLAEAG